MIAHQALKIYFERKKRTSPGFTLRGLARRVGLSPSFVSRVLNGERPIPGPLLAKLAHTLDIEPELLSDGVRPRKKPPASACSAGDSWTVARREVAQILRNWYYIAILELTTLTDFDGTIEAVAKRLRLSRPTAEIAVRELLALGLLKDEEGRLKKVEEKLRIASGTSTQLVRKFHDEMMQRCQNLLRNATDDEDFQKRLVAGITISCTPEAVQAAKRKLNQCLYEIANDLTAEPGTEVYHLATQLFPLT